MCSRCFWADSYPSEADWFDLVKYNADSGVFIDPEPFLEFVHDVDFSELEEDSTLKTLLGKIKGKKSIYTNATSKHAKNILKSMGIFEEFEIIFDIKDANYIAKPDLNSYLMMKK